VLPATRHRWARPAFTPARLDLPVAARYPQGPLSPRSAIPKGNNQPTNPTASPETTLTLTLKIYLPRRDGRLSWPWWLAIYRDGLPVRRQSPIQVVTNRKLSPRPLDHKSNVLTVTPASPSGRSVGTWYAAVANTEELVVSARVTERSGADRQTTAAPAGTRAVHQQHNAISKARRSYEYSITYRSVQVDCWRIDTRGSSGNVRRRHSDVWTVRRSDLCDTADDQLFNKTVSNSSHILHTALTPPSTTSQHYNLRRRTHTRSLPEHFTYLSDCNSITRMLYKHSY